MSEIEVQKLELQLHHLQGRIKTAKLGLAQLPEQETKFNTQIGTAIEQIKKIEAQIETFKNTSDTASI